MLQPLIHACQVVQGEDVQETDFLLIGCQRRIIQDETILELHEQSLKFIDWRIRLSCAICLALSRDPLFSRGTT